MLTTKIAYPEWTDFRKKSGLDPLGMQNSSIDLYQRLLPGISNVTLRVRYYGLYAWLVATYADREGRTATGSWQRFLRRSEALFALIASYHGDNSGVAGVRWAGRLLPGKTVINFSPHADPEFKSDRYLMQAWGAFGAAYGGQVLTIGVLSEVPGHDVPVPSAEFGDALAKSFSNAVAETAEIFLAAVSQGSVTTDELDLLEAFAPSQIGTEGEERKLYEDLLFRTRRSSGTSGLCAA